MEKMFQVIEDLKKENVIQDYAIGGAMALLFYDEPRLTYDIDVFIFADHISSSGLDLSISVIREALAQKGYSLKNDYFIIEEFPVQFLPPPNDLVKEAIKKAVVQNYSNTQTRVFSLEYLMAIMVDTNRPKDWARLAELISLGKFDKSKLFNILNNFNLQKKWEDILEKIG